MPLGQDVLGNVDILTPNEPELRTLLGLSPDDSSADLELARAMKSRGIPTLVVTLGSNGALVLSAGGEQHVPAVAVEVVDSTGAGDAFNAALAVALAEKMPLGRAVELANCAGALACTKLGSIPASPKRAAVDALWKKHFG
jgi:ribokinase